MNVSINSGEMMRVAGFLYLIEQPEAFEHARHAPEIYHAEIIEIIHQMRFAYACVRSLHRVFKVRHLCLINRYISNINGLFEYDIIYPNGTAVCLIKHYLLALSAIASRYKMPKGII